MLSRTAPTLLAVTAVCRTIYDFQVNGGDHKPYDLSQHKGHPILIYNVASNCSYTKGGYEAATELYNKYKDQGFTVLAFPCNQFGGQEPGNEAEVKEMVCTRFKAEFPIMQKVEVNGDGAHPLFKYLTHAKPGLLGSTSVKWNFTAFLVDGEGVPVERFAPATPESMIDKKVVQLLNKQSKL